jgi:hypothetical protein
MVLVLVLAALGLLVTALITANSLWAWISIGLSVVAGVLLVADWLRRRRQRSATAAEPAAESEDRVEGELPVAEAPEPSEAAEITEVVEKAPASEQTELLPASGELDPSSAAALAEDEPVVGFSTEPTVPIEPTEQDEPEEPAPAKGESDPGEEQTDAADLLIVSELDNEVLVVDEYPRYHVTECVWLADRDTIPIGVSEARELGFTPCVRCGPDAKLAAAHRAKRKSSAK